MNVLSLFDGISTGRLALERAGVKIDKYFSSEVNEDAIKIANKNYPQDKEYRLGDVTKISAKGLPKIDLLIGGSPCQNYSGANAERLGDKGEKSKLLYEYLRLYKELKPTYFLLENVRMKKEHQNNISRLFACEPIVINSEVVSGQLRHRLYWTNIPQLMEIQPKNISFNSILEYGYSDRSKARTLLASDSRPLSTPIKMVHRYFNTGFTTLIFKDKTHYNKVLAHFNKYFRGKSAKEIDAIVQDIDTSVYDGVRYMLPTERERLQNLPDGYTEGISDNMRAHVLGDGWTTDVITHIFKGLK